MIKRTIQMKPTSLQESVLAFRNASIEDRDARDEASESTRRCGLAKERLAHAQSELNAWASADEDDARDLAEHAVRQNEETLAWLAKIAAVDAARQAESESP